MVLPTSITPWYIWTALGALGILYAPYFIMYKQNEKFSKLANYAIGLLMFSTSSFVVANTLLDQLKYTDNNIFVAYDKNKNNIDNVVFVIFLLQIFITMCITFNELYALAETKKEKLKYILATTIILLGLLMAAYIIS